MTTEEIQQLQNEIEIVISESTDWVPDSGLNDMEVVHPAWAAENVVTFLKEKGIIKDGK